MPRSLNEKEFTERRSAGRVSTIYRPVLIETAEFAGFCLVRNLSSIGMMGQIYTSLAVGTAIQVGFGDIVIVPGHVAWCNDDKIGISFDIQIDVESVLTSLAHRSHRGNTGRAPRLPLQVSGEVIIDDRPIPVELQDISQKGLKVRSAALQTDDEVTVCLPGLEHRKATVRWTQAGMSGLNFIRPIPYDQLGEWVIRQQLGETLRTQPIVDDDTSRSNANA